MSLIGSAFKFAGKKVPVLGSAYALFEPKKLSSGILSEEERNKLLGIKTAHAATPEVAKTESKDPGNLPIAPTKTSTGGSGGSSSKTSSKSSSSKVEKYYRDYLSRGYTKQRAMEKAQIKAGGSSSKSSYEKQISNQRKAQEEALEKMLMSQRDVAERTKTSGNTMLDNLINALKGGFESSKGTLATEYEAGTGRVGSQRERAMEALEAQKAQGLEEFGDEKSKDIARLRSFYNSIGTGGSEQAAQGLERMQGQYAKRFGALEESYGRNVKDVEADYSNALESLELERSKALAGYQNQYNTALANYNNKRMEMENAYSNTMSGINAQQFQGEADIESGITGLLRDLQEYQYQQEQANFNRQLQERKLDLETMRTNYQVNRPYSTGGSSKVKTGYQISFNPLTQQNEYNYVNPLTGTSTSISEGDYLQAQQAKSGYLLGGNLGIAGQGANVSNLGMNNLSGLSDEQLLQMAGL